jgi:D-amino-acid dehydrogenase
MKIAVIGAGIVGMCTAFELAQDGHEVSIFERNSTVAQEASFACAGHLSPSLSHPLALPAWPHGAWLRAASARSPLSVGKGFGLTDLKWMLGWKTPGREFPANLAAAFALASYSLEQLHKRATQGALAFEQSQGNLLLWQSEAELQQHQERLKTLKELGLASQVLTAAEARALEPALQSDYAFAAASYFPGDEIGNCRQFAHLLKGKLTQIGAQLHFGTSVSNISTTTGIQIRTADGVSHSADQVVICAGTGSAALGLPGFQSLPLTTVWSYSLSAPIREPLNAPRSAVQDCRNHVTISRIGARVRVAGGAEVGSRNRGNDEKTVKQLYRCLNTLFPGAADFSRSAQLWKGASQFTPDGLPLIGPGSGPGIWLNLGHGQSGWTMAAGSARLIADQVGTRPTELDVSRLQPGRFQR